MATAKPKIKKVREGYVPVAELRRKVRVFLKKYGSRLEDETAKIAYYCQMTAYNAYVDYYEREGWCMEVNVKKKGRFHYKLQPTGNPSNFSYFKVEKAGESFWLLNNVPVESALEDGLFYAPDVVLVRKDTVVTHKSAAARTAGYERTFYFVRNADLVTFAEVKNVSPFPELLFSYQGLIFELMPEVFFGDVDAEDEQHPAPALLCSFSGSRQADRVAFALGRRFRINILARFLKFSTLPDELRMVGSKRSRAKLGRFRKPDGKAGEPVRKTVYSERAAAAKAARSGGRKK